MVINLTSFADVEQIIAKENEQLAKENEQLVDPIVVNILIRNRESQEQIVGKTTIDALAQMDLFEVEGGEEPIKQGFCALDNRASYI